jgi:hypothetical protein
LSKIPELFAEELLPLVSWLVLMLLVSEMSDLRDVVVRELLGDGVMACGIRPYSAK